MQSIKLGRSAVDPPDEHDRQVIRLRLTQVGDLFDMPYTDPLDEHRGFCPGIETCLSIMQEHRSRQAVRLELSLPAEVVEPDLPGRVESAIRRYCDDQIRHHGREKRALRWSGARALYIGLPVTIIGLVMVATASSAGDGGSFWLVVDHLGWVLAWIGLWFPLDQMLFYSIVHKGVDRQLARLRGVEVMITARPPPGV